MTIGGSWIFCMDENGSNAKMIVTGEDGDIKYEEEFDEGKAIHRLRLLMGIYEKESRVCETFNEYDGCGTDICPIWKNTSKGCTCSRFVENNPLEFLRIYNEWKGDDENDISSSM